MPHPDKGHSQVRRTPRVSKKLIRLGKAASPYLPRNQGEDAVATTKDLGVFGSARHMLGIRHRGITQRGGSGGSSALPGDRLTEPQPHDLPIAGNTQLRVPYSTTSYQSHADCTAGQARFLSRVFSSKTAVAESFVARYRCNIFR